eukprot:scaffold7227_cov399-Prasinococcus_capsulatus_cf.AAC.8
MAGLRPPPRPSPPATGPQGSMRRSRTAPRRAAHRYGCAAPDPAPNQLARSLAPLARLGPHQRPLDRVQSKTKRPGPSRHGVEAQAGTAVLLCAACRQPRVDFGPAAQRQERNRCALAVVPSSLRLSKGGRPSQGLCVVAARAFACDGDVTPSQVEKRSVSP